MSRRTTYLNDTLYEYLLSVSLREHPILKELRAATAPLSTSNMQIAPEQGQFMGLLAGLIGARKTLEIGVYTGYSALSVALALPDDGQIVACDINEEWTQLAREFWHKAKVDHKIKLYLAPATETLDKLIANGESNTFDFAFIDADKTNYDIYYEKCLVLMRAGGLILLDNVLLDGSVVDPDNESPNTAAMRKLNQKIFLDQRVSISLLPIADGLTLARKR
jgi:predicted O-methyltransferase YrrM